ncbi:hypothetical protein ABFS82_02G144400 [Erythranthe guttata]
MTTDQKAEIDILQSKLHEGFEDEDEKGDNMSKGDDVVDGASVCSFSSCEDSKQLDSSLQNTLSPGRDNLIKQILRKYGDITKGSILKSIEAKKAFLQLVVEVVERLHSHTLDTLGAHEMHVIQKLTDDAATVGFHVDWLQQRIKKIVSISKYRDSLMQLNDISEKINAAKIALLEMELQHMILKKEIDSMKAEMDMEELCVSNLCVGLL